MKTKEIHFHLNDNDFTVLTENPSGLVPDAENICRRAAAGNTEAAIFYADSSFRKPEWSPDLFLSWDYIGDPFVVRTDLLAEVKKPDGQYHTAGFYALKLACIMKAAELSGEGFFLSSGTKKICRISEPLTNSSPLETSPEPEDQIRVLGDFFRERGIPAAAESYTDDRLSGKACRIHFFSDSSVPVPKVSVIIPSKDHFSLLRNCVESIIRTTDYGNYEILVVDNGSPEEHRKQISDYFGTLENAEYLYRPMDFNFSRMCNAGAAEASGELLLFLNDDTIIRDASWMQIMAGQALMPWTGAVGAKLLYENGTIQHCGVIRLEGGPTHALQTADDTHDQYYGRNLLPYDYLAVTAACLMIEKKKFEKVGGFSEEFRVTYNDVDLGYSLAEKGYFNLVRNDVVLTHLESVSRGLDYDNTEKFMELVGSGAALCRKHPGFKNTDPFLNPAFSPIRVDFRQRHAFPEGYTPTCTWSRTAPETADCMTANLDFTHRGQDSILLSGWASCRNKEADENADRYVIIENGGGQYVTVPAFGEKRTDVAEACGFPDDAIGWYAVADEAWVFSSHLRIGVLYRYKEQSYFNWVNGRMAAVCNIEHRMDPVSEEEITSWKERPMTIWADRKEIRNGVFFFDGYAFFNDDFYNCRYAYRLLLEHGDDRYLLRTDRVLRPDLSAAMHRIPNLYWSGFRTIAALPEPYQDTTDGWDISVVAEDMESHTVCRCRYQES